LSYTRLEFIMTTNVLQTFNEFKSRLELSETLQEAVSTHHNAIRDWIEDYDSTIKTKLIGSLQRKTRIQPRPNKDSFDIDILVILGNFNRWVSSGGISPGDVLDKVEDIVSQNETYKRMGPETDNPTIIVEYSDNIKVELVPAYLDQVGYAPDGTPTLPVGRGYWVPKNDMWAMADYDYDADYVSKKNEESDGWLIPTIKMLKSAKRYLFSIMQSYHLEVIAANILPDIVSYYKSQGYQISYPSLIFSFFAIAKDKIKFPKIQGSKSPYADSYLNDSQKNELARIFSEMSNYCQSIVQLDGREAIEGWKRLFGDPFPSYG